jgi:hypothetical protein
MCGMRKKQTVKKVACFIFIFYADVQKYNLGEN